MLDWMLKRDDVLSLLKNICNDPLYYDKDASNFINYELFDNVSLALFLCYDALFKYQVIISDVYYFDDYLLQVDMLFQKMGTVVDISDGIYKILGNTVIKKLSLEDSDSDSVRYQVLNYIYDKYIIDGYYICGYPTSFFEQFKCNGIPVKLDVSKSLSSEILELFTKYHLEDIIQSSSDLVFTNNMIMGCYYAASGPNFFSQLLCNNKYIKNKKSKFAYLKEDYVLCFRNLQKLSFRLDFSKEDRNSFYKYFKDEWKYLSKGKGKISLAFIPRSVIDKNNYVDISSFIENCNDCPLGDAIFKLIGPNSIINSEQNIAAGDILFDNLMGYRNFVHIDELPEENSSEFVFKNRDEFALSNAYGKVTLLLILGSILITFGVIVTVFMISRGM